ncbi:MAG: ATP-dependent helicase, partial [Deltaproteobacteria bacterium]
MFTASRHVLVVAPPGSGKTLTLASRAARLLSAGNAPEAILAITFTNRAAGELKERLERLTGIKSGLNISTFHSFSLRLLKEALPGFKLMGRQDSVAILKGLMRKNPEAVLEKISAAKNLGLSGADDELAKTIEAYDSELKRLNAIDLDGLLIEAVRVLEDGKGENIGFLKGLKHLLIDEFQDINSHQARLIGLLEKTGVSVFAIGDPDQAIYGFRGAGVEHFLDFQRDYPQAEVIRLKNNFRSGKEIVLASQAVIANNKTRLENAVSTPERSAEIRLVRCASEESEAEFIIREIEKAMGGFGHLSIGEGIEAARFSDFAVLFRTNRQAA